MASSCDGGVSVGKTLPGYFWVRHTERILVDQGQDGEVCSETGENNPLFRQDGLNRDLRRLRGENAADIRFGRPVEWSLNSASVPRW